MRKCLLVFPYLLTAAVAIEKKLGNMFWRLHGAMLFTVSATSDDIYHVRRMFNASYYQQHPRFRSRPLVHRCQCEALVRLDLRYYEAVSVVVKQKALV